MSLPLLYSTFLLCLHSRCNFVFTPYISFRSITCYQNSIVIRMIYDRGNSNSHNCRLCQSGPGRIGRSALFWAAEDTSVNINWEIPLYSPSTSKLGVLLRNYFSSPVNMTHYFQYFFSCFSEVILFSGNFWMCNHDKVVECCLLCRENTHPSPGVKALLEPERRKKYFLFWNRNKIDSGKKNNIFGAVYFSSCRY